MEMNNDWLVMDLQGLVDATPYKEEPAQYFEREDCPIIKGGLSTARYGHPAFKKLHNEVRHKLQAVLGERLYPTYYFDRFYFHNTRMTRHTDREACEISVSLNISHNLKTPWPIFFDVHGEHIECYTEPGDGVLYKGIEVPHWREFMVGEEGSYFHQIFLHYVRADGYYLEFAYDQGSHLDQFTHEIPPPK